jgi:hypothetical protein
MIHRIQKLIPGAASLLATVCLGLTLAAAAAAKPFLPFKNPTNAATRLEQHFDSKPEQRNVSCYAANRFKIECTGEIRIGKNVLQCKGKPSLPGWYDYVIEARKRDANHLVLDATLTRDDKQPCASWEFRQVITFKA